MSHIRPCRGKILVYWRLVELWIQITHRTRFLSVVLLTFWTMIICVCVWWGDVLCLTGCLTTSWPLPIGGRGQGHSPPPCFPVVTIKLSLEISKCSQVRRGKNFPRCKRLHYNNFWEKNQSISQSRCSQRAN